jgi:hypothetical protein
MNEFFYIKKMYYDYYDTIQFSIASEKNIAHFEQEFKSKIINDLSSILTKDDFFKIKFYVKFKFTRTFTLAIDIKCFNKFTQDILFNNTRSNLIRLYKLNNFL